MRADLPEGTIELEKASCGCQRVKLPSGAVSCLHDENCTEPPFVLDEAPQQKGRLRSRRVR